MPLGIYKPYQLWKNFKPPLGWQINYSHPLTQGLVSCLLFNEAGGKTAYDLTNTLSAGILSGTTGFPAWSPGNFGTFLSYVGANSQYVRFTPVPAALTTTSGTLVCWIKPSSTSQGSAFLGYGGTNNVSIYFGQNATPFKLRIRKAGGDADGNLTIPTNTWGQVVITATGSAYGAYINGVADTISGINSGQWFGAIAASAPTVLAVGGCWTSATITSPWSAATDFFMFYNRVLSAKEVKMLYIDPFCFMQNRQASWGTGAAAGVAQTGFPLFFGSAA